MSNRKARRLQRHFDEKGRYETDRVLKKVRKEIKNGRESKPGRRNDWHADYLDDPETFDQPHVERIVPRGARQQREALKRAVMADLRQNSLAAEDLSQPAGQTGLVIQTNSGLYSVDLGGERLSCTLRGSLGKESQQVAAGDEVLVSIIGGGQGVIEAVLPRRSQLARVDVSNPHQQQIVAANVDQLLIVASWRQPPLWLELVDRYLITALRNNLKPILCLTKMDLADDTAEVQTALQPYLDLGYQVLWTSTITGMGIDALRRLLRQKSTVLAGLSGVGKSSLLAAVEPDLQVRIGAVNEERGEGRHTTTQATWYNLSFDGAVVDTPGIREFGLSGLAATDLVRFYPEMITAAFRCRFANCSHLREPDCAVQAAVDSGHISAARYHSYKKIYESLR